MKPCVVVSAQFELFGQRPPVDVFTPEILASLAELLLAALVDQKAVDQEIVDQAPERSLSREVNHARPH